MYRYSDSDKKTDRHRDEQPRAKDRGEKTEADSETCREVDRQTNRQADGKTDR